MRDAVRLGAFLVWTAVSVGLLAGSVLRPYGLVELSLRVALVAVWLLAVALGPGVAAARQDRAVAFLLATATLLVGAAALAGGTLSPDFGCLLALALTAGLLLPRTPVAVALLGLAVLALGEALLWKSDARLSSRLLWAACVAAMTAVAMRVSHSLRRRWEACAHAERAAGETPAQEAAPGRPHSEALALLGRLAASVAHEISNPLTYLSTNLQLLEREVDSLQAVSRRDVQAAVVESTRAVERMTEVLRDLRRFARSEGVVAAQLTEVRPVVEEALLLASARLRRVRLERRLVDGLPPVTIRRRRLVQVLANLLLNAADAVDGSQGMERRIVVGAHPTPEGVALWVEDTGPGLSAEAHKHLFEPFFTTKPSGKGTGLGLALSREYVEADGGTLTLEPASGGGTRAVVRLPRAPATPASAPVKTSA
ncbi:MAG: sensor histidine kinase [Myxococcaceae bacterium]